MAVISNNLANANTTGFARSRAVFEDLLYQNLRQPGSQSSQETELPTGLMLGTGVRLSATEKVFSQGNVVQTANDLDIAIEGRGFFQIQLPDGTTAFTRDGSFQKSSTGELVTTQGYTVQPGIQLPDDAYSFDIGADGTISATGPGGTQDIGSLQLASFVNPGGLQAIGGNLLVETVSSGTPQTGQPGLNGLGSLVGSALESSNVNTVEELVNMIETQRAYEINSKAISTADRMLEYVNNNLGR
jgi:flagellar basal-body rod protein FlgG